jgi:hypothetical protein
MPESTSAQEKIKVAELLLASGEPVATASLLETVLASLEDDDPQKIKCLRVLAVSLFASDKIDQGAGVSRKILRMDPTCVASMHNLALSAVKNNRYRSAWGWVRRGLAQDPLDNDLRRLRSKLIWESISKFFGQITSKVIGKKR